MDLLDFFKGKLPWRKLYLLMQNLPRNSLYAEALAMDPDVADEIISAERERRKRREKVEERRGPSVSEYTPEVARLDVVIELLQVLNSGIGQLAGQKPQRVKPQPRPHTAIDKARDQAALDRHNEMHDEVEAARERRKQRAQKTA